MASFLSRFDIETITAHFTIFFALAVYIQENELIKIYHSSTEKRYLKLIGQFVRKKLKAKSLQPGLQLWCGVGFHQLSFRFLKERLLHLALQTILVVHILFNNSPFTANAMVVPFPFNL